ncbi:MAG TPA: spermidine/putrescine ABC transporter substrate-binding protein, partial [Acidobacteriota bacterium]|nr:spermidine/putrescine ABC transporter substrate-binding protein [Acidobacteriota bacterium]
NPPLLLLIVYISCSGPQQQAQEKQLNLYIWSAYITEETVNRFEKETGIRVHFDTYDSNEALLEKMQSGVADYDVIVPSDYMVRILKHQNLLEKLDHTRLPNVKNLSARFRNLPFDPNNEHSVPFLWGTTGIGYNKTKVTEPVDSWAILWNPKYKDRILMLDDLRESFGAALKWKGHSINTKDRAELENARDLLLQQKPLVKTYSSSNFDEVLLSGDVWLAHGWSGQLAKAKDQNKDLDYAIPKEGGTIWVDNSAIPISSRHKDAAYTFMNWCLDAKNAAEITNISGYPSPNEAAKSYVKPEILNDRARYPDEATLSKCEFLVDLGETSTLLDRYWTEIKSR